MAADNVSDGIAGTSDWYEKPNYPVNCAELKAMIDAEWPKVMESNMAIERLYAQTLERVPEKSSDNAQILMVEHHYVSCWGVAHLHEEPENLQIFFTEEETIRALWYHYQRLTPAKDFLTDNVGELLIWREHPEISLHNGIYKAIMRYSGVYRTRNGEYVAMWSGK